MNKEKLQPSKTTADHDAYEAPAVEELGQWETVTGSIMD